MKSLLIAAASVTLLTALPAQAADLAATAASLRDKALADPTAWDVLENLTTEVGPRPVGSPAITRAKDWSVETFKRLGFANVKVETFETGAWSRGRESASVISPYPQALHILGLGGAYATAHKDEIANIVFVGESDEGAGVIWKVDLPKASRAAPQMQTFANVVAPLKVAVTGDPSRFGGSDVAGMVRLGAPVADLHQDASRYFDLHHSAADTLDKVSPLELAQNVAVWTALLYTVADSDIDFRKLVAPEAK